MTRRALEQVQKGIFDCTCPRKLVKGDDINMSLKIASLASRLLPITLLIGMIAIIPICDANLAFMANNNNQLGVEVETTFGTVDVPIAGHVGFGYQRDDGKFVFGSFGPSPGNLPLWAPGKLVVEIFDDWAAVERYLITNFYTTYRTFNVDNPNPQSAWDTMERFKGSYYNLLTSVVDIKNSPLASFAGASPERPDSENCLTFAKKVLEAYGVKNLPSILPFITSAPNNYFLSIPGEIHSTISDIEQESALPSGNEPMVPQESAGTQQETAIEQPVNKQLPSGASIAQMTTALLPNGAPQSFAADTDGKLWSCWKQSPDKDSSWNEWSGISLPSGVYASQVALVTLSDGRLELWVVNVNGKLWISQKQTTATSASWTGWMEVVIPRQIVA